MASPEEMIANEEHITEYIPQRPPMVMIGRLIAVEEKTTTTALDILPDNLFVADGLLREAGLIENMAQTAAAGAGYASRLRGTAPRIGFIGGIKNLEIFGLPSVGTTIMTDVTVTYEVMDATVAQCMVRMDQTVIARCELKIFLQ